MLSSKSAGPVGETSQTDRLASIEVLRGIAALSVAWFHFTQGNPSFTIPQFLKSTGTFAWVGVEVFFVISGFVIPYALSRSAYQLKRHWTTFMLKRLVRLEPPYLISIVVVLILGYVSSLMPGYMGVGFEVNSTQLALHLFYLSEIFGYPWLNPVFWTLAIEFQYYLFISLIFPIVMKSVKGVRFSLLLILLTIPFFASPPYFLLHWMSLFAMGIVTCQHRLRRINTIEFVLLLTACSASAFYVLGGLVALIGVVTALSIAFVEIRPIKPFLLLGGISYSIYLLHVPVGGRVINLAARYEMGASEQVVVLVTAVLVTLLASFVYHRLVEFPARRLSGRLPYR